MSERNNRKADNHFQRIYGGTRYRKRKYGMMMVKDLMDIQIDAIILMRNLYEMCKVIDGTEVLMM